MGRVSFAIKLQACHFIKRLWHRCFPMNFARFLKTILVFSCIYWINRPHSEKLLPFWNQFTLMLMVTLFYFDLNCLNMHKEITAWNVSKYGDFSGPYFPVFGLNTERHFLSLRIQSECGKIRTRKNSVFGHFSRSGFW